MSHTFCYLLILASILIAVTPLKKIIEEQVHEFHGGHHEKLNCERANKGALAYHSSSTTNFCLSTVISHQFIVLQDVFFGEPVEISIQKENTVKQLNNAAFDRALEIKTPNSNSMKTCQTTQSVDCASRELWTYIKSGL